MARRDVAEHLGEQVLDELERADRLAELHALLRVFERVLVGAHLAVRWPPSRRRRGSGAAPARCRGTSWRSAGGSPRAPGSRSSVMWAFCTTFSAILFSIFSTLKPGVVLFSTMKPLTWLSSTSRAQMIEMSHHGALPIQRFWPLRTQVSPSRFAVVRRPPPVPGADQRLGEAEAADLLHARHRRQPLLLLLLGARKAIEPIARPVWTPKKVANDGSIRAHLHGDQADQQSASARAAVALDAEAADVELLERRDQLERERSPRPSIC